MGKVTRVALATKEGVKEEFEVDHAERILAMRNSGWHLPSDSEYKYENGTISRADKTEGKRAAKA